MEFKSSNLFSVSRIAETLKISARESCREFHPVLPWHISFIPEGGRVIPRAEQNFPIFTGKIEKSLGAAFALTKFF